MDIASVALFTLSVAEATAFSVVTDSLPDKKILFGRWVNRIHELLSRGMTGSSGAELAGELTADLAEELRSAPNWEEYVTFAVAWTFQDHVAIYLGDGKFRINVKLMLPTFEFV